MIDGLVCTKIEAGLDIGALDRSLLGLAHFFEIFKALRHALAALATGVSGERLGKLLRLFDHDYVLS